MPLMPIGDVFLTVVIMTTAFIAEVVFLALLGMF
jgi:hypothetical protein